MARRKSAQSTALPFANNLFRRKHATLFLRTYLSQAADQSVFTPDEIERASTQLAKWAQAFKDGHLDRKETELDAEFLQKIFGEALGYRSISESPDDYHRQKNPTIAGVGIADGALGLFSSGKDVPPIAVVELKGADTDLDVDKKDGRTAVQQCWDYLNQLPDTPWGIVSNYASVRLYHKSRPATAYEEFTVDDFLDPARVREFFYVFRKEHLVGYKAIKGSTKTTDLLRRTADRQREIGDELYNKYADYRDALIADLMKSRGYTQDQAIHTAQLLLDRIIFMAFCEDRGLLRDNLIANTWKNVPPLSRVVNPRWQNFLDAFHFIDKGHANLDLPTGYNGGLFKEDPLVDKLQLDDRWTDVFQNIGEYDFSQGGEVSVDVLGHIFERSINELEKRRAVGLFGDIADKALAAMPKSAERKRFGTYYTPPQFTELIVERTLGALIESRVDPIPDLSARVAELRKIKVVDPACGSGAFLIAAYDRLERGYSEIARLMRIDFRVQDALNLENGFPDYILADNLHGVDLSEQAVEITKLALWIRSARKGRALVDLDHNIHHGNSLVRDPAVHPDAFDWHARFDKIFAAGGFDVVIGNPPWERLKIQEREFFSLPAPEIASAVNAADRRRLIAAVETARPDLWIRYLGAQQAAEKVLAYVRTEAAGFPLTGRGDVNTYMLFAELGRRLVAPTGRVGLLVPSGIATDNTTKEFFADLIGSKTLTGLFDFENRRMVFPDVDGRFKFSVLLMTGLSAPADAAEFVFFAHSIEDLSDPQRQITLSPKDLKLLNPNTRTCPIFRTKRDADLTKHVYRHVPILVDHSRKSGGNPWGVKFCRMYDQTNDAEHFNTGDKLQAGGYRLEGNRWIKGDSIYLPLYEAKMIQGYDHRAAGVRIAAGNWMRQGQTEETSLVEHQNPESVVQPRYWVDAQRVERFTGKQSALFSFKDVTSATNQRTMIAAMLPEAALMNSAPFLIFEGENSITPKRQLCLLANFNSLAYDFIARQKVGGLHLNFFIVEQLPTLPPEAYDEPCPWDQSRTLEDWIAERALKLTCTADDMRPLAAAAGFAEGVHKWKDDERATLRAELDAAYFHLYRLDRDDVQYILGTFQGIRNEDEAAKGGGVTRCLILGCFDQTANF